MDKLIFKTIVGSTAYGTSVQGSDVDYKGVFKQNNDDILSFGYIQQKDINKDETYYEVRRFLELLKTGNPTMLELLYMPEEFILEKQPEYELIRNNRDKFLTKKCLKSFGGYAFEQIKKSKGKNKKINWERIDMKRKSPIDFMYCYIDGITIPIEKFLKNRNLKQEFCGLVALKNFRDTYKLYYDYEGHKTNSGTLGYKGIVLDNSNSIRVSSVPKNEKVEVIAYYNQDGYSMHCKKYKEYKTWLDNRNEQRYVDFKGHGQKNDGKNLLHCVRLLDVAEEIATQKTINVKRPNADYLIDIRKGNVDLDYIISESEIKLNRLEKLYENSDLPDDCDDSFMKKLLLDIRKM